MSLRLALALRPRPLRRVFHSISRSDPILSNLNKLKRISNRNWRRFATAFGAGVAATALGLALDEGFLAEERANYDLNNGNSTNNLENNNDTAISLEFDELKVKRALEASLAESRAPAPFVSKVYRTVSALIRATHVAIIAFPLLLLVPAVYFSNRAKKWTWSYVRWGLEHLGGAWIKLGQWASTRPDMFSPEVVTALASLCRDVAPHASSHTLRALNDAFGSKENINSIFKTFPVDPVASGAIAQVYRAELKSGRAVAVKVLHPGIAYIIDTDIRLMKYGAGFIELFPGVKWLSLSDGLKQFALTMAGQTDLRSEGLNLARFRRNFEKRTHVVFPEAIWASNRVLIESWEDGEPVRMYMQAPGSERSKAIAHRGLHTYLQMMLMDNFVHADLHPGNIAVRWSPSGEPILVLYDVGLITEASDVDWAHFKELFEAIVTGSGRRGAELMVKYARSAQISDEQSRLFSEDLHKLFEPLRTAPLKEVDVGLVLRSVLSLVRKYQVQIEGNFATLCVGTAVLEGIGRQLDPDLNLLGKSLPYFTKKDSHLKMDPNKELVEELTWRKRWELAMEWMRARLRKDSE